MSYASDGLIDALEHEVEALQEENAELRERLEDLMRKKHRKSRRKKKVNLPTDRYGNPVNVGDCLMFDDDVIKVTSLTLYSDGEWTAGTANDDFAADNIKGGIVISLPQKRK